LGYVQRKFGIYSKEIWDIFKRNFNSTEYDLRMYRAAMSLFVLQALEFYKPGFNNTD
jgi:hypothetical protein